MNFTRSLFIAAALISTGSAALAQATIDQNKALAGNVTPGDSAGYPITINQPGSYKLMSNLVVPAGTSGIVINAPNVTLDLNGFTVSGAVTCSQNASTRAVTCSAPNNASIAGIWAGAADLSFTIRNGTVQGFAGYGIFGSGNDLIERVRATQNSYHGIDGAGSSASSMRIVDVQADLNGGSGINMVYGVVSGSRLKSNGSNGFDAAGGALLVDSSTSRNFGYGIRHGSVSRTLSFQNGTNRGPNVISLGGNVDGTIVY